VDAIAIRWILYEENENEEPHLALDPIHRTPLWSLRRFSDIEVARQDTGGGVV
jgi:hypothetical protein